MSDLLAMAFSTEAKAEAVRRTLLDMHEDYLIEPGDAAIVTSCAAGLVKLNQLFQPASADEVTEMLWGPLIELLLKTPLTDNLAEFGINDDFMKEAANTLRSGNPVLLLLVRNMTTGKLVSALRGAGGKFLRSSFDELRKEGMRAALERLRTGRVATGAQIKA